MRSTDLRLLALLALAFPAVPAAAQRGGAPVLGGSSGARAEVAAKELRRIFHLANGQAIRVVAREVDGGWEYQSKGQWKKLHAGQVARVELESEALQAFGRARDAANLKKPEHRLELARLAFDHGLVQEGVEQLEFVLRNEPDRKEALDLLGSRWLMSVPSLDVPPEELGKAKAELLRFGAGAPAAVRELAVKELAKLPADETLRADLEKELRSSVDARRSFAALALRRLMPGESLKPLLMHAVLDPSEDVRRGSSRALALANDPVVIAPVVKALNSLNGNTRMRAAEALGNMGYPAALEPLMNRMAAVSAQGAGGDRIPHSHIFVGSQRAYIQDFDVEVAQFQAVADPQINTLIEGMVTDAAVSGELVISSAVESVVLRRAAGNLVGQAVGDSNREWLRWWEQNKHKWLPGSRGEPRTDG
jgi:hypothetical protein